MYTEKSIAIVIPVYNEADALRSNFLAIKAILDADDIACRFMFVDDGSKDTTWSVLESLGKEFPEVGAIRFARNFGKELALCAGLDSIDADLFVTMDSDLQHPPKYIKPMLERMDAEGVNLVEGIKASRGTETLKYKLVAKSFYKFLKWITGLDMDNSSDFKVMDREVVESIRRFKERNLFFRGITNWVGFKRVSFPFEVEERQGGNSHFSTAKLMLLAGNAILSYTSKPLYLTLFSGVLFLIFAIILGIQTLFNYFSGHAISGFSTVILLLLITGSMVMLSLGIIGAYISRIYEEIKDRPRYIISKKI